MKDLEKGKTTVRALRKERRVYRFRSKIFGGQIMWEGSCGKKRWYDVVLEGEG